MKRKSKALPAAEPVNECPQCTTPTRCGRIGDGKRGPRCVGRSDGKDDCDCLNRCGDDPWLAKGKARPCARRAQEESAAIFRATAGPAEYASWFSVPSSAAMLVVCGSSAPRPPCTVCGTAYENHGSYPTCATHPYTPDGNCQHVAGARCGGAECKAGCVRGRTALSAVPPTEETKEKNHG